MTKSLRCRPVQSQPSKYGDDVFLLLHGKRVAKRGRSRTPKVKRWIPIVPWIDSVSDETESSVIIRYARDKIGRA
jgi:hypothetical protein